MSYPNHLVFADNEVTTNISPVLDERLGVKNVWIAHTDYMRDSAKRLKAIYKNHGITVRLIRLSHAFDAKVIINELKSALQQQDLNQWAINISCGTRVQSVAAVKAFENTDAAIFYLLPNDDLAWLQPDNRPGFNIADNLRLDEFLRAHGVAEISKTSFNHVQAHFANVLINAVEKIFLAANQYKTFHFFATQFHNKKKISFTRLADGRYKLNTSAPKGVKVNKLVGFLNKLTNQKLLNYKVNHANTCIIQNDHANWQRLMVGGTWLEYWVYRTLKSLQADIAQLQDIAYGVQVKKGDTADEIDVMFLANNQLFIIECKTGGYTSTNHNLHRLDSLRNRLGGSLSHAMYITTQKIPKKGGNRDKAQRMHTELIDQSQLINLRQALKNWINAKLELR